MATKFIANSSCTLAHKAGSGVSGGVFVITSLPSLTVNADGSGVYTTPLTYTFSGGNFAGCVNGTVATLIPQTIAATAVKVKADGSFVMRVGDFGTMTAQGTKQVPPPPPGVLPAVGAVEISDAGNTKVKGN